MTNISVNFHGIEMRVLVTTEQAEGRHCTIEMVHPPSLGPSAHTHPLGVETFYVIHGKYTFCSNRLETTLSAGECSCVSSGTEQRYLVGSDGGKILVVCPPGLENYFRAIAISLAHGPVTTDDERLVARVCGQNFRIMKGQWLAE